MNIDLGSFAFGSSLESGGGTPSWGTALGQSSPDYKFSYSGCEAILIGMLYCSVPLDNVRLPIGKGGRVYVASNRNECQLASLFRKVYINGIKIDYPFIMVLMKEESDSHPGRKGIKYSDKIEYEDNIYHYSNQEFINKARLTLNMDEGACWFVYKIEVHNQDELHFFAVIVDSEDNVVYENSSKRRNSWLKLIPNIENEPKIFSSDASFENNTILQQIFYGAPGTGKSHEIKKLTKGESVIRTTFHPDSDYSTFVGCYKPTMDEVDTQVVPVVVKSGISLQDPGTYKEKRITYKFVMQAFLKAYLGAWKKWADAGDDRIAPQFLVIEEINRGNCAQIFGDLFQLLDRSDNNFSEYPIEADTDLQQEIERAFKEHKDYKLTNTINVEGAVKDYISNYDSTLSEDIQSGRILLLPPNLYIWATMNTSDQSLFPIDSAFKRRWEWRYIKIAEGRDEATRKLLNWTVKFEYKEEDKSFTFECSWWEFIKAINEIIAEATSSDDKKLGYFFCKPKVKNSTTIDEERFVGKVVFYLWNDVFKDEENPIFKVNEGKNEPSFDAFYKEDEVGKTVVDTAALRKFMHNVFGENKDQYTETEKSEE